MSPSKNVNPLIVIIDIYIHKRMKHVVNKPQGYCAVGTCQKNFESSRPEHFSVTSLRLEAMASF